MNTIQTVAAMRRDVMFQRAMRKFIRDPEGSIAVGSSVIDKLIVGWGNEAWSSGHEYLASCVRHALASNGPILECGSGLTTLLLAVIAQKSGKSFWSLEHQPEWSKRVTDALERFGIELPHIHVKPLHDYGTFSWYDPPLEAMPERFSLVICDGPPGATIGGRFGLAPILGARLGAGCIILLDDAERQQERVIANRWSVDLNAKTEMIGSVKPFIKLHVRSDQAKNEEIVQSSWTATHQY